MNMLTLKQMKFKKQRNLMTAAIFTESLHYVLGNILESHLMLTSL